MGVRQSALCRNGVYPMFVYALRYSALGGGNDAYSFLYR